MSQNNPTIQILDVDYFINDNLPVIRIYGKDSDGKTIGCLISGFEPYFYAHAENPESLCTHLKETFPQITKTEIVPKFKPIGYQTTKTDVVKITVTIPTDVRDLRKEIVNIPGVYEIFEADILYHHRYFIDNNLHPMKWISITPASPEHSIKDPTSLCDQTITAKNITEIDRLTNAPLKYFSWDIECLPINKEFPTPDKSPIILISMAFSPAFEGMDTLVLAAKHVPDVPDDIVCFPNETTMLNRFFEIFRQYDPDIITGYNIKEFDTPYTVDRCEFLSNTQDVAFDTRVGRNEKEFAYRKYGQTTHVSIPGRIIADALPLVKAEYTLTRYTLENVAKELLDKEKLDVPPNEMEEHWNSPTKIHKFLDYSRRDSELAMDLIQTLSLLDKYVALAQVSGITLHDVIARGQTILVEQILSTKYLEQDRLMAMKPDDYTVEIRKKQKSDLKGADVLSPKKGLSKNVIILDYKSLYPTIMMARNICYTTLVTDDSIPEEDLNISPTNGKFIKSEIYKGVIPSILEDLLAKRVETKDKMKETSDPDEKKVLDATQLALKILLNSFYGYSGYERARLFSLILGNSVTSYGRYNIHDSSNTICNEVGSMILRNGQALTPLEAKFFNETDMLVQLESVYGDTDSLFIHCIDMEGNEFKDDIFSVDMTAIIGERLAEIATDRLPDPMQLEYEATAKAALLLAKKRYALWQFEPTKDGWNDKLKIKGLEMVRSDWCDLTSSTQETLLEVILKENDINKCVEYAKEVINKVKDVNDTHDPEILDGLMLSKKLSRPPDQYKNKQPHVAVYDKKIQRGEQPPVVGDRIPYYITKSGKTYIEQAEDPSFVIANSIEINTDYYVTKQMVPPLLRLLEHFGVEESMINVDRKQKGLFDFSTTEKSEPKPPAPTQLKTSSEKKDEPDKISPQQTGLFDY
jgi:DNA polymerase I